jgi:hypothetical protein
MRRAGGVPRVLLTLLTAAAVAAAVPAAGDAPVTRPEELPSGLDAHLGRAASADSTEAGAEPLPRTEPGGPDIRAVRGGAAADLLDPRPLARYVGEGHPEQRASLARGALPAAMSAVLLAGRSAGDRLAGGLDVLSAGVLADGTPVVLSGPDLSLLPVRTASALNGPIDSIARGLSPDLAGVVVSPGRVPGPIPWARLTIGRGDPDWNATAVEFGRTYRDGAFGLSGLLERHDGGGPTARDASEIENLGGRLLFQVGDRWRAEIVGLRTRLDRSHSAGTGAIETDRIRSDVRLVLSRGGSRLEAFHTGVWLRSDAAGRAARSATSAGDGVRASIGVGGSFVDAVDVEVAWHASEGSLLAGEERRLRGAALVSGRVPLAGSSLAVSAGGRWLGGQGVPAAAAVVSGETPHAMWSAGAEVGGRHPTAIERLVAPLELPGRTPVRIVVEGNEDLEPETALVVSADYVRLDLLSGVGLRGELARVAGPIALGDGGGLGIHPVNAGDETAGAVALWAAMGDSSKAGARSTIDLFWTDDHGAITSLAPIPRASLAASAWVTTRFFEGGFLSVRWEVSLKHELGLSRGPWSGHIEDAMTSVDVAAGGRAGPVRIFVEVRDLLDGQGERLPDRPTGGRRIAAGFSSSFWN